MKDFSFVRIKWPQLSWAHLFIALASACKAIKDKLAFHFGKSVFSDLNPQWWDPDISWMNKYKDWPDDPSPAFFLADTALVWLTDAWHLFDFLTLIFLLVAMHLKGNFFWGLVVYGVVFNTLYYLF